MEDLEMEAITAARVANEERLGFCPGMWEWQKYSRLNGVSLTEWELFAERVRGRQWMLFHRLGATTSHEAHAARKLF